MAGHWECPACGAIVPDAEWHSCGMAGAVIDRHDAARMTGEDDQALQIADEIRHMIAQNEPTYDEKIIGVNCYQLQKWADRLDPFPEGDPGASVLRVRAAMEALAASGFDREGMAEEE